MFQKFVYYLKIQLQIHNWFYLGPYKWPMKRELPSLLKSTKTRYYQANLLLHSIYVFVMSVNFLMTLEKNKTEAKMLGFVFLDCFVAVLGMRIVFFKKADEGITFINYFLKFEKGDKHVQCDKSSNAILEACMIVGILTCFTLPIFMISILLKDPCMPPHLGYILLMKSTGCTIPAWPLRIFLLLFDAYMWLSVASTAVYFNTNFFLLGAKCMEHYIEQARLKYFVRVNKYEDFGFRKMSLMQKKLKSFHIYKQVEILSRLFNEILKTIFIPSIVGGSIIAIVISLYASFKLHRLIPMPGLAFFPVLAVDGLCGIVSVKMAAGVLDTSQKFLATVKNNAKLSSDRLCRKEIKSLNNIKVRFGSSNYIDKMTPFIFLDFCLVNTANLMLIT